MKLFEKSFTKDLYYYSALRIKTLSKLPKLMKISRPKRFFFDTNYYLQNRS